MSDFPVDVRSAYPTSRLPRKGDSLSKAGSSCGGGTRAPLFNMCRTERLPWCNPADVDCHCGLPDCNPFEVFRILEHLNIEKRCAIPQRRKWLPGTQHTTFGHCLAARAGEGGALSPPGPAARGRPPPFRRPPTLGGWSPGGCDGFLRLAGSVAPRVLGAVCELLWLWQRAAAGRTWVRRRS